MVTLANFAGAENTTDGRWRQRAAESAVAAAGTVVTGARRSESRDQRGAQPTRLTSMMS